jgi:hypothetical protein
MSQKFRKLGFPEGKWEELKPLIQKTSEGPEGEVTSWNNEIVDIVYEIGHICTQWDVDAEGNKVCVATDPLYAVDIVWHDEVLEAFVPYLVFPVPVGVSSMGYSLDKEYAEAYCVANPDADYCQPPQPPVEL